MSSAAYEQLLRESLVDLSEMQELDCKSVGKRIGPNKTSSDNRADHAYFLQHWTAHYLRYVQIARKLDQCHDQLLQPQKRQDVRVLLDSCVGRMLEMKHKIVERCGDYTNLDEALVDLKLTPDALEIPVPRYYFEERRDEVTARRSFIEKLYELHNLDPAAVREGVISAASAAAAGAAAAAGLAGGAAGVPEQPMTAERAVEILQCCERGRQGRNRAKGLRGIFEQEDHQRRDFDEGAHVAKMEAARQIQKIFRAYRSRQQVRRMRREEHEFLGMEASAAVKSNIQQERLARTEHERKMRQRGNAAELQQEARDMRTRIKVQEGGRTMEEMVDEVLVHMANLRLASSDPDAGLAFPTPEEGGSLALLGIIPKPLTAEEQAAKAAEEEAARKKQPAQKEVKKTEKQLAEEALPQIQPSMFWDRFTNARERYVKVWNDHFRRTYLEQKDFDQRFDKELLRQETLEGPGGVMAELRRCVDELVMVEVANLKERLERERGGKRKKKGGKGKKGGKKKLPKDPFEGKSLEDQMSRLVAMGILQLPPEVRLGDYVGAHNYMGGVLDAKERKASEDQERIRKSWEALLSNWNDFTEKSLKMTRDQFEALFKSYVDQSSAWAFEPSMQQVRQAVAEYCILPLGSQLVHDLAPNHKTVLLYGPPKTGKTMLVHATCTESGSNLFNLSPAVLVREGVAIPKLVASVVRLARALAPSVIYIDEIEKVFPAGGGKGKKKGKDPAAVKAAKIKKDLVNAVNKDLEPTDRVVIIGSTKAPIDAHKDMPAFFRAAVYCVHPDYASRLLIWQTAVRAKGVDMPDSDFEVLTSMSARFASGAITKVVDDTLTPLRIKRASQRPLAAAEFLPALARAPPIFKEDYDAVKEFTSRLPMTMRRAMQQDFEVDDDENDKKPKPKAKPKAKK